MTVSPQGVPAELKGRELQWEPVLHFSNKGRLKGLAGLPYFRSKQDEMGGHPQRRRPQHL